MLINRSALLGGLLCLLAAVCSPAADTPVTPSSPPTAIDQAALEKQLAKTLTGAVFAGNYSVAGQSIDKPPHMEKYTVSRATKLKGDFWLLEARVQYGKKDVTVPMTLEIKWAGDTPVITLTDLAIPPLGTFTSRVMIYGDRYAGTWQHDQNGGHLWGRIERAAAETPDASKAKPNAGAPK